MNVKGIVFTIFSAILFGITPILASYIYCLGAGPITVVFFRSLFVLPILFIIMKLRKVSLYISRYDLYHTAIIAMLGSGLTTMLLFSSYQYIDVGSATTLHFLYPICVSLLCFFVYREALSKRKILSLCFAGIGTLCFFDISKLESMLGILLAILSAITYAFYMVQLAKKHLTKRNQYLISFYMAFFTVIETLLYHCIQPSITMSLSTQAYIFLCILSIISSFLAVVLLQMGIRELGPSNASLFCLFEPITSIFLGAIFLHEAITLQTIVGCVIILLSLIVFTLSEKKKNVSTSSENNS